MIPKMDLAKLSYDELIALNKSIIAQIKVLQSNKAKSFDIGDTVTFRTRRGLVLKGIVTRRNKRTVSVHVKASASVFWPTAWKVSPSLLQKA